MDAAPREDSDDEDPIPRELAEDEALLNEFVDYSREEIDFMLAWNAGVEAIPSDVRRRRPGIAQSVCSRTHRTLALESAVSSHVSHGGDCHV